MTPAPAAIVALVPAAESVDCVAAGEWATLWPADRPELVRAIGMTYGRRIYLRAEVCDRLELLEAGARPRSPSSQRDFAEAVWVVGHEYAHVLGELDEHTADCAGLRRLPAFAAALGVGRAYAATLADYVAAVLTCGTRR